MRVTRPDSANAMDDAYPGCGDRPGKTRITDLPPHMNLCSCATSARFAGAVRCLHDHLNRLETSLEFDRSVASRQPDRVRALLS